MLGASGPDYENLDWIARADLLLRDVRDQSSYDPGRAMDRHGHPDQVSNVCGVHVEWCFDCERPSSRVKLLASKNRRPPCD
jgi:hypothetical protein